MFTPFLAAMARAAVKNIQVRRNISNGGATSLYRWTPGWAAKGLQRLHAMVHKHSRLDATRLGIRETPTTPCPLVLKRMGSHLCVHP